MKEAREILNNGDVLVDGKIKKDYKYPVGIFDVVEFPKIEKSLRVVPSKKGFKLVEIEKSEKNKKLCKIRDKTPYK
ncbi:MAG: S4 domain-containing protein, partial [Candidatus Aenigmatarchaeota archaeon]